MPLKLVEASLFESEAPILCQGVNCQGRMGKGIAVWFKHYWPAMYGEYASLCLSRGTTLLGSVCVYSVGRVPNSPHTEWVMNCFTQPYPGPTATYKSLRDCMDQVRWRMDTTKYRHIAMPLIGSGLGGLLPKECLRVIEDAFKGWDKQVDVHVLPHKEVNK